MNEMTRHCSLAEPIAPPVSMSCALSSMAGFEVTAHGRFWVTAEGDGADRLAQTQDFTMPLSTFDS
jgi:hypothetical protein